TELCGLPGSRVLDQGRQAIQDSPQTEPVGVVRVMSAAVSLPGGLPYPDRQRILLRIEVAGQDRAGLLPPLGVAVLLACRAGVERGGGVGADEVEQVGQAVVHLQIAEPEAGQRRQLMLVFARGAGTQRW